MSLDASVTCSAPKISSRHAIESDRVRPEAFHSKGIDNYEVKDEDQLDVSDHALLAARNLPSASIRELGQPVRATLCWNRDCCAPRRESAGSDLWLTSYNPADAECVRYNPDTGEVRKNGPSREPPRSGRSSARPTVMSIWEAAVPWSTASTPKAISSRSSARARLRVSSAPWAAGSDGKILRRRDGRSETPSGVSIPTPANLRISAVWQIGVNYAAAMHAMSGGHIFVGFGMPARLVHYRIDTGSTAQILPEKYFGDSFVYDFFSAGHTLYAYLWPSGRYLVYDIRTRQTDPRDPVAVTAKPLPGEAYRRRRPPLPQSKGERDHPGFRSAAEHSRVQETESLFLLHMPASRSARRPDHPAERKRICLA